MKKKTRTFKMPCADNNFIKYLYLKKKVKCMFHGRKLCRDFLWNTRLLVWTSFFYFSSSVSSSAHKMQKGGEDQRIRRRRKRRRRRNPTHDAAKLPEQICLHTLFMLLSMAGHRGAGLGGGICTCTLTYSIRAIFSARLAMTAKSLRSTRPSVTLKSTISRI